ncbi:MAG: type II CRISPR-associated endonuclease Cas1 [Bdellovibrionales bacterium]|nr:type II CRISPR-associated endonuclease Cas1 [Bdellovibrionales bacterium]
MSNCSFGQFVEISKPNLYLSLHRGFLEVREKKNLLSRVPLDDIAGVSITGYGCSHSSNILVELSDRGIPVSICGSNFSPRAIMIPLVGNCKQNIRIQSQIKMSSSLKSRLWKEVIQLKLKNQSLVLKKCNIPHQKLLSMSKLVRLGDRNNLEAQGARVYWLRLFSRKFKRDKNGDGINAMLNYAYAIIRSCVARGVVTSGLHPSIGIHHKNTYNPMCLVDDLMEPFRPIGDYVVRQLCYEQNCFEVNTEVKRVLTSIVAVDVESDLKISPLFQVISRMATSLALVLSGEKRKWGIDVNINLNNFDLSSLNAEIMKTSA